MSVPCPICGRIAIRGEADHGMHSWCCVSETIELNSYIWFNSNVCMRFVRIALAHVSSFCCEYQLLL